MGVLDSASDYVSEFVRVAKNKRKVKPLVTVDILVLMCCEGCERKVKNSVKNMKGVYTVEVNRAEGRLKVTGNVLPEKVLKRVKSTGKTAQLWPYVQHNLVPYPHAEGVYDVEAPPGFVRNLPQAYPSSSETPTSVFNDGNPHFCYNAKRAYEQDGHSGYAPTAVPSHADNGEALTSMFNEDNPHFCSVM
ncbi:Heavy metal-associated isoprenylated plant protein 20 [Linum grandiflorum]